MVPSLLNFHFLYINPKSLIPSLISLHLGSDPRGWLLHRPVVHQVVSQAEGCTHWWSELLLWGWSLLIFKIFMTPHTTVWEAYGMCKLGSFEKTRVLITRDSELAIQALVRCHISSMSSHKVCTNNRALCRGIIGENCTWWGSAVGGTVSRLFPELSLKRCRLG